MSFISVTISFSYSFIDSHIFFRFETYWYILHICKRMCACLYNKEEEKKKIEKKIDHCRRQRIVNDEKKKKKRKRGKKRRKHSHLII